MQYKKKLEQNSSGINWLINKVFNKVNILKNFCYYLVLLKLFLFEPVYGFNFDLKLLWLTGVDGTGANQVPVFGEIIKPSWGYFGIGGFLSLRISKIGVAIIIAAEISPFANGCEFKTPSFKPLACSLIEFLNLNSSF